MLIEMFSSSPPLPYHWWKLIYIYVCTKLYFGDIISLIQKLFIHMSACGWIFILSSFSHLSLCYIYIFDLFWCRIGINSICLEILKIRRAHSLTHTPPDTEQSAKQWAVLHSYGIWWESTKMHTRNEIGFTYDIHTSPYFLQLFILTIHIYLQNIYECFYILYLQMWKYLRNMTII